MTFKVGDRVCYTPGNPANSMSYRTDWIGRTGTIKEVGSFSATVVFDGKENDAHPNSYPDLKNLELIGAFKTGNRVKIVSTRPGLNHEIGEFATVTKDEWQEWVNGKKEGIVSVTFDGGDVRGFVYADQFELVETNNSAPDLKAVANAYFSGEMTTVENLLADYRPRVAEGTLLYSNELNIYWAVGKERISVIDGVTAITTASKYTPQDAHKAVQDGLFKEIAK